MLAKLIWLARKLGPDVVKLLVQAVTELLKRPAEDREAIAFDMIRLAEIHSKVLSFDAMMAQIRLRK